MFVESLVSPPASRHLDVMPAGSSSAARRDCKPSSNRWHTPSEVYRRRYQAAGNTSVPGRLVPAPGDSGLRRARLDWPSMTSVTVAPSTPAEIYQQWLVPSKFEALT